MSDIYDIDSARRYLEYAQTALDRYAEHERDAFERGRAAGIAQMTGAKNPRTMTGPQFLARLMNCVSPESAGWAELHRLAQSGFGRHIQIDLEEDPS